LVSFEFKNYAKFPEIAAERLTVSDKGKEPLRNVETSVSHRNVNLSEESTTVGPTIPIDASTIALTELLDLAIDAENPIDISFAKLTLS
jgi:hypothetical protein